MTEYIPYYRRCNLQAGEPLHLLESDIPEWVCADSLRLSGFFNDLLAGAEWQFGDLASRQLVHRLEREKRELESCVLELELEKLKAQTKQAAP